MNKRAIAIVVGIVVALIVGLLAYVASNRNNDTADKTSTSNNANASNDNEEAATENMDMPTQDSQSQAPSESDQSAASRETDEVTISDFAFGPKQISIKVGTTVTWTNQDSVEHNVKMENGSSDGPSSELLGKGESYSYTFKKAGVYSYLCTPHPTMKGTVTVTE